MFNPSDLLYNLAEHDNHPCFIFNINSKQLEYVNPAFKSFFDLSGEKDVIKKLEGMVNPADLHDVQKYFRTLKLGPVTRISFRMQLERNKISFLRANIMLENIDGIALVTGYIEDQTEYVKKQSVDSGDRKPSDRNNSFSHELAGTLASIQTYTLLLSRKTKALQNEEIDALISALEQLSKESVQLIRSYKKVQYQESQEKDLINNRY